MTGVKRRIPRSLDAGGGDEDGAFKKTLLKAKTIELLVKDLTDIIENLNDTLNL